MGAEKGNICGSRAVAPPADPSQRNLFEITDLFPGFLPRLQTFASPHSHHFLPSNLKLFPFLPPKTEIPPIAQTTTAQSPN